MNHVSAIVLAAGRGSRFRSKIPKPLVKFGSKPIIVYSLAVLNAHPSVRDIIVVTNDNNSKEIAEKIRDYRVKKVRRMVRGGRRRQDSVMNALCVLDNRTDLVLIHDAARPFIDRNLVSRLIKEASRSGAAIAAVPVKNTIKKVTTKFIVKETIDRSDLWEIQTPQVFRKNLILRAFKRFGRADVTDDAMLVEKSGKKVNVVFGSYANIKITTPEDLVLAEAILKHRK